jgi:hypothetical protein
MKNIVSVFWRIVLAPWIWAARVVVEDEERNS